MKYLSALLVITAIFFAAHPMPCYCLEHPPTTEELQSASWWLRKAFESVERVEDRQVRKEALMGLLQLQTKLADREGAERTEKRLLNDLKANGENSTSGFYRVMAEHYARGGQFEPALKAAKQSIESGGPSWDAYVEIARQQALRGDVDDAKATAAMIEVPDARERALQAIAYEEAKVDLDAALGTWKSSLASDRVEVLAIPRLASKAGRWDIFNEAVRHSLEHAPKVSARWQASAYRDIAQVLKEAENTKGYKPDPQLLSLIHGAMLEYLETSNDKNGITEVARGLVMLKQFPDAKRAIKRLDDHFVSALNAQLAAAFAEEGRYDEAMQAAAQAMSLHEPLKGVAAVQARRGDFKAAKETAEEIKDDNNRNWAYYEISTTEARRGRFADARRTAEMIVREDPPNDIARAAELKLRTLLTIASEQIKSREHADARRTLDRAIEVSKEISKIPNWNQEAAKLAQAYLQIGDFDSAEALARENRSPGIFIDIARSHLHAARMEEFQRTLALAYDLLESGKAARIEGPPPYASIAALYFQADQMERAEQAIHQLINWADESPKLSIYTTAAYATAAGFYLRTGRIADFWRDTNRKEDLIDRAGAAIGVAIVLIDPEKWDRFFNQESDMGPNEALN